jgi:hypothetical protein
VAKLPKLCNHNGQQLRRLGPLPSQQHGVTPQIGSRPKTLLLTIDQPLIHSSE